MKKKHAKQHTHTAVTSEHAEGSYFSYTLGFTFSIIATLIPYLVYEYRIATGTYFMLVVIGSALVQLFVQLVLFLHLNLKKRSLLNLTIFLYTIILVGIVVVGTLWIMHNLTAHMADTMFPDGDYTPQSAAF